MSAAASLLTRAVALLPDAEPFRLELLPELAEALIEEGEFDRAVTVLDGAAEIAERVGDERLACRAGLERFAVDLYRSESGGSAAAISETEHAIAVFDRAGDQAGLARAWRLLMFAHGTVGRFDDAARAAERFVRHATRAGDVRLAARGASGYATVAMLGPTPVAEMLQKCEELIAQVGDDRKAVGVISGVLAVLHAMQGSFDRARDLYRSGRSMLEELGPSVTASSTSTESSRVEFLAGDPAAAERELRRDYDALGAIGEKYLRSTIAGHLAAALYQLDRLDEAAEIAAEARALAAEDDTASQVLWRLVQAKVAARRGESGAEALAEQAVTMVEETPSPSLIADAKVELGEVLVLVGRPESAGPPWREALELYERKGDVVSAARVSDRLAALAGVAAQR
jgi:tetratricopeptide (TPR) repeat protein